MMKTRVKSSATLDLVYVIVAIELSSPAPFASGSSGVETLLWHVALFNLARDPGEQDDRSAAEPELYEELLEIWREERKHLGILLPSDL